MAHLVMSPYGVLYILPNNKKPLKSQIKKEQLNNILYLQHTDI